MDTPQRAPERDFNLPSRGLYLGSAGTVYFPANELRVSGDGVTQVAPYTNIIANTLQFSGNGALSFNSNLDGSDVPLPLELAGQVIQLVR